MEINLKSSQSLMKAIKKMHTLVESPDVEKQRASQENISGIFSKSKDMKYENFEIEGQCGPKAYVKICDPLLPRRWLQHGELPLCQKCYQQAGQHHIHGCTQL